MNKDSAFFFVHNLVRLISDFKVVPRYLVDCGVNTTVYAPLPSSERDAWWTKRWVMDQAIADFPSEAKPICP